MIRPALAAAAVPPGSKPWPRGFVIPRAWGKND
jgi:hypothetical protein